MWEQWMVCYVVVEMVASTDAKRVAETVGSSVDSREHWWEMTTVWKKAAQKDVGRVVKRVGKMGNEWVEWKASCSG